MLNEPSATARNPADLIVDALLPRFLPLARTRIETSQAQDGQYVRVADSAYDQMLDSLTIVASYSPSPLLEALIKWRESESLHFHESPSKSSIVHIIQRKLATECVFTSACIRFVECCPSSELPEQTWSALEDFVFDWLINADRLVSQVEYPSLYDLRSILLEYIALMAGALSTKRLASMALKFFNEVDARMDDSMSSIKNNIGLKEARRRIPVVDIFTKNGERYFSETNLKRYDSSIPRIELLSIIHGMRFIRLNLSTPSDIMSARAFLTHANPLSRLPSKKKTEVQHALCVMLASVLTPLVDLAQGHWPPCQAGESLNGWNSAVMHLRQQLTAWVDKQSSITLQMEKSNRHLQVAYPLIILLLCVGDQKSFEDSFSHFLDMLYKLLKEKNNRGVALDCLHRLVHFYLSVYAHSHPKGRVWGFLQGIASQLLATLKKSSLNQESQHDKIVEFCVTISSTDLDFAMNEIVLGLLRVDGFSEAKVVGLKALLAVVSNLTPTSKTTPSNSTSSNATSPLNKDENASPMSTPGRDPKSRASWPVSSTSLTSFSSIMPQKGRKSLTSLDFMRMGVGPIESPLLAPHIGRIRIALGGIIKECHSSFGNLLLISNKSTNEPMSKEKQQGWVVFRWALKCVPHFIPEQWRNDKMTEIIPLYAISIEPSVREEAVQVLFRTVHDLPLSRFPILQGMSNFILRIPDDYPLLIHTSLTRLVQLMQAWIDCISQEPDVFISSWNLTSSQEKSAPGQTSSSNANNTNNGFLFDFTCLESIGLIFLASSDVQIRMVALNLLKSVRNLQLDLITAKFKNLNRDPIIPERSHVIDIFEETGDDVVEKAYFDRGRWQDLKEDGSTIPSDASLQSILEGNDKFRWGRCLCTFMKYCSDLCPDAVHGARVEVVARMSTINPVKIGQILDSDPRLEQWYLYAMFACACPPEEMPDRGLQSIRDLLQNILPPARLGHDWVMHAATMALGFSHTDVSEAMLTELNSWVADLFTEMDSKKWKNNKLKREDLRIMIAQVYRLISENLWPGTLQKKAWLKQHFVIFLDDSYRHLMSCVGDICIESQPLRFALASVSKHLAKELITSPHDRFDAKIRKRLFELLASWCDQPIGIENVVMLEYKREIEKVKTSTAFRLKDPIERSIAEKEINDQVEAIKWMSLQAMAALLYGPCFDENAKKLSGKVFGWIKTLMDSSSSNANSVFLTSNSQMQDQLGSSFISPVSLFSHPSFKDKALKQSMGLYMGLERKTNDAVSKRMLIAKDALLNILVTNLNLFQMCIDQCYNEDTSIADTYFVVLAEVYMRYECPCQIERILSLILYKVVDPSPEIRDNALRMLEVLSFREWSDSGEKNTNKNALKDKKDSDQTPENQFHTETETHKQTNEYEEEFENEIETDNEGENDAENGTSGRGRGEGRESEIGEMRNGKGREGRFYKDQYLATVVGSLPDSYHQFQFQLSKKLAREHPELSEILCEEIMQRQLDAVDIIAQHQVLTCMSPWMENLNFVFLWESGWSERLLKSLYYVTWKHGDQFPDEIEKLWSTVASKWKNIIPIIDFLISKGVEDCDSNVSGEVSRAMLTYFGVAKRISLYIARVSPKETIDHLVYELSQRMHEDGFADYNCKRSNADNFSGGDAEVADILEFSQGEKQFSVSDYASNVLSPKLESGGHHRSQSGGSGVSWYFPKENSNSNNNSNNMKTSFSNSDWLKSSSAPSSVIRGMSGHMSKDSIESIPLDSNFPENSFPFFNENVTSGGMSNGRLPGGESNHWLRGADIALILLAEIAYENDEDFRNHLPLLFHVIFTSLDSSEGVVLEHSQQLLVNLLYTLAGRHLELYDELDQGDIAYKQHVVNLIKYVQSKKGLMMWENEEISLTKTSLQSSSLLSSLVSSVVEAIFFQGDLRERWGQESLKWAMECSSRHLSSRSHQIYRSLRPCISTEKCVQLLKCLHRCFTNPSPPILGFVMEILLTLQVIMERMDRQKMILYPQLFWGCIALLHTDFVHVYAQSLQLLAKIIDLLPLDNPMVESVLIASMPKNRPIKESEALAQLTPRQQEPSKNQFKRIRSFREVDLLSRLGNRVGNLGAGNEGRDNGTQNRRMLERTKMLVQAIAREKEEEEEKAKEKEKARRRERERLREEKNGEGRESEDSGEDMEEDETVDVLEGNLDFVLFEGLQPMVLKGLMSNVSHDHAIEVLHRITLLSCDKILGESSSRLLMHCIGLLPWLCLQLQLQNGEGKDMASASPSPSSFLPSSSSSSPFPAIVQLEKAKFVAHNIAEWCAEMDLQELAYAFEEYAYGRIQKPEEIFSLVCPHICSRWFPENSHLALSHLLRLLEKGPKQYQSPILLLLHSLLHHSSVDLSQTPQLYSSISQLLENSHCREEALAVMKAILETAPKPDSQTLVESGSEAARARSEDGFGRLHKKEGREHHSRMPSWISAAGNSENFSSREESLIKTKIALERVIETYGNLTASKRRERFGRLVPFVDHNVSYTYATDLKASNPGSPLPKSASASRYSPNTTFRL